jgi:hypothetical protein
VWGLKLDVQNGHALLEMSFLVDLSAYCRPREKLNVFPKLVPFTDACLVSNRVRLGMFQRVYNINRAEPWFPVAIDVGGLSGRGVVLSRGDLFFLMDEVDEDFGTQWNSGDFEAAFHAVTQTQYKYEGHPVVKFRFSAMKVAPGNLAIVVSCRESSFSMRPSPSENPHFTRLVQRLKPPEEFSIMRIPKL